MKLYYAPGTCSLAVWISLEWAGADYELEKAKLGTDEYREINPLGAVPAIELDSGQVRSQLPAIIHYIAAKYPDKDLGPDGSAEDELRYNEILAFLSADLHPAFTGIFAPTSLSKEDDEESINAIKEAAMESIDFYMSYLDSLLEGKEYIYGDRKTALDAIVYVFAGWTEATDKTWKEYENIKAFMEKMENDEAIQKVMKEANE